MIYRVTANLPFPEKYSIYALPNMCTARLEPRVNVKLEFSPPPHPHKTNLIILLTFGAKCFGIFGLMSWQAPLVSELFDMFACKN